jgi:thiol-disulfide isomerase/thioredoxin
MPLTDDPPASAPPEPTRPRRGLPMGPVGLLLTTAVAAVAALAVIWIAFGNRDSDTVKVQDALNSVDAGPVVPEGAEVADVGSPAPDVRLDYLDGGTQQLSELRGTPVVLNFWSSTCAPCLQEMPAINKVAVANKGKVTVVGVDVTDTAQAGKDMVARTGVTYRNARDPRSEIFGVFGGTALPRTVLIDAGGTIVDTHSGALTESELNELLVRNHLVAGG